jgi:hypothetical protein
LPLLTVNTTLLLPLILFIGTLVFLSGKIRPPRGIRKGLIMEPPQLLWTIGKEENGTIKISFDASVAASVFWLSEDEALDFIQDMLKSLNARSSS